LLIHVDQHRFDCVGVNGHPAAHTPNLDRLAAEGVNFTHAFCPIAVCMPARTSLMTGRYPTQHGCLVNDGVEGYRPARADTADTQPADQSRRLHGSVRRQVGDRHGRVAGRTGFRRLCPGKRLSRLAPLAWLAASAAHQRLVRRAGHGRDARTERAGWGANAGDPPVGTIRRRWPPLLLRWDTEEPHLPSRPPEPFAALVKPEHVPPWPSFPDPLMNKPTIQRQQLRSWGIDGWTWERWAPIVAYYLGVVALIDQQVGRILVKLDELGLKGETLVVYTSDHGDLCGGHGMIDKHYVMYDDVMRVPLMMRWPGKLRAGHTEAAFVTSALDLATTFCTVVGIEPPETFQGHDLIALANCGQPPRALVFGSYHGAQFGAYSQRMVRTRAWKYIWNATAEDELYDLAADPGELHNRAAGPACSEILRTLRGELVAWMAAIKDPLLNEWTRRQLLDGHKR
jgi:arylsulfatase A-like enzyme